MESNFLDFIQDRSLFVWASTGWDSQFGGSYEALDASGTPLQELPKRTRVQLRQIYSYSKAHAAGLYDATQIIDALYSFLSIDALSDPASGCARLVQRDGQIIDKTRDLYDHAFLLLACASSHEALGRPDYIALAHRTQDYLDTHLKAENGGWFESNHSVGSAAILRRQNPHMHLFEAYLALYEATSEDRWRLLANDVFMLFERVFYNPATETLFEYFNTDWTPVPKSEQKIEPGHMLEWSWLLDRYGKLTGQDTRTVSEHFLSHAMKHGLNEQTGLIYDSLTTTFDISQATHRMWPQTEYIKALVVAVERGDAHAESVLDDAVRAFMAGFVSKKNQDIWIDKVDALGCPINEKAPASTFYHAISAAREYARLYPAKATRTALIGNPRPANLKAVIAKTA